MGISEGLEDGSAVDCSVGTIVWVRRRNGSWWPGRILGSNELSASHLMSPRSGTPVKLLGREDASVDWYNLEKSKRVKAFRCGEFNECIERAESSQGIPIRKREKYARREDAILHALELEKEHLEKKQQKLGIASNHTGNKISGIFKTELVNSSSAENHLRNNAARDHRKSVNFKSDMLYKRRDSSHDQESMDNPLYTQNVRYSKQARWEDDNSEAVPRMRGLQDFGLRIAQSKGKFPTTACESSDQPVSVDHLRVSPSGGRNIGTPIRACNMNDSLTIKRKRSQSGVIEESLVKRRDRRRPLVQVLRSSAKLPACQSLKSGGDPAFISGHEEKEHMGISYRAKRSRCVYLPSESSDSWDRTELPSEQMHISPSHCGMDNSLHPGSLSEENTNSGLNEAQECDSSEGLSTEPDIEEDLAEFSDPSTSGRYVGNGGSDFRVPGLPGNLNEDLEESLSFHPCEQSAGVTADVGASKWQLKGKRNTRNLSKRPMEVIDGKDSTFTVYKCNGSINGSFYEDKGGTPRAARTDSQWALGRVGYRRSEELNYSYDEGNLIDNDLVQTRTMGFVRRSRDQERSNHNINGLHNVSQVMPPSFWEGNRLSQAARGGYWEDSDECFNPLYTRCFSEGMDTMLVDVDLKVQATYQGERVPLVSLMSRLNGKAIIGHPVQIEVTEDGSADILLASKNSCEESLDVDGNKGLTSVWRTARRTAMYRVPRPHPSSEVDPLPNSDIEINPPARRPNTIHLNHKMRLMKKSFYHARRPVPEKKFPKKLLKKISLSSQKTRTLSSIAVGQKLSGDVEETKFVAKNGDVDGSINPKGSVPPVTCVPVKLVFSRILEAVGRSPSKAATHEVFAPSAEWKPS